VIFENVLKVASICDMVKMKNDMKKQTIQQDINPRVQLYADSKGIFLRVWDAVTRRGTWRDMAIQGNQIPVMAQYYLTPADCQRIKDLIQ
jgi:hypothetical protein